MFKILIFLLFSTIMIAGEIKVAVAANVSYAIQDLTKAFHKIYPDIKVQVILGSSGKLTAQIKHGAPYGLFLSADMRYPEVLYKEGLAVTKPRVYAQGTLAYLSAKEQDFSEGIKLVDSPKIHKIAVANPKTAPYGIATAQALKKAGVYKDIVKKFVYGESISQTLSFTMKAADLGFVASSALFSPQMAQYKKGIHWAPVDTGLYTPINQGIVVLKNGQNSRDVDAFYKFMLSAKAKEILKAFGYLIP